MDQSTLHGAAHGGLHVAIIMDGNGRWARARGRSRAWGHREGAKVARRIVEAAPSQGIGVLTLYAFSSDNWRRPAREVAALMRLFEAYLRGEVRSCVEQGVQLRVIGRRDRLPARVVAAVEAAEAETAGGDRLCLRVALDYSARDAIVEAVRAAGGRPLDRDGFTELLGRAMHAGEPARDVDLLIRTGGEQRLSDFLLWECAYAELYFTGRMWPEFTPAELEAAVREYHRRERRFGGVPEAAAS
ncbi:MAG TPA: di-trans,poly-cis-decaprenylcistransferase [Longimicrobiales bacterium]